MNICDKNIEFLHVQLLSIFQLKMPQCISVLHQVLKVRLKAAPKNQMGVKPVIVVQIFVMAMSILV